MAIDKPSFLDTLFRRYACEVRSFMRRRVGPQDAEDLVQDVYLRLLRRGDLDALQNPRSFLHTTANSVAADHYDKIQVRARHSIPGIDPDSRCSAEPALESTIAAAEQLDRIWAALSELPAPCRYVFLLNRIDGLTHVEVAQRLSISEKTVERYIKRAVDCCYAAVRPKDE